jgi:thiol-disulfide isomerase/thioredoxin
MKYIFFSFLLIYSLRSFSQVKVNGQLSGFGAINTCQIFLPIGEFHNAAVSKTVQVKSDSTFALNLDIKNKAVLEIRINTKLVYLYVEPGDDISFKINYINDENKSLQFTGNNAPGNYWYNLYNFLPASNFARQDKLIKGISNKSANDILNDVKAFLKQETRPIDSLRKRNLVNDSFAEIAKKDVYALQLRHLEMSLNNISKQSNIVQKNKIKALKWLIYSSYPPTDTIQLKTIFGASYLESGYLTDLESSNPTLKQKYANQGFDVYNQYFYLPPVFQEFLLGRAILYQKIFSVEEFDFDKGVNTFRLKYPKSNYLPVIESLIKKNKANLNNSSIIVDTTSNINSIQDIISKYKGKNILIDLWATWCIPCKMEFPYYKSIKNELKTFDILPLFISIDEPMLKRHWETVATDSELEGVNILANKNLMSDIEEKIYKGQKLSIPRYILINKKGEIIDSDAPRPSDKNDLIKEFKDMSL